MFIIYDIIFVIFAAILIPIYLLKGKFHRGFMARLGFLPKNLTFNKPIWVHAVSVGEVMAVRALVEGLRNTYPDKKFVISTVTSTGNKIARSLARRSDYVTYLPLDLSFIAGYVIDRIDPCVFIIAETELWPNLITCLHKKKIPVIIVNGRISDASFKGYWSVKFLVRPVLDRVGLFCVQSALDRERLMRLGTAADKIRVTGNMKFDIKDYTDSKRDYTDCRKKLGLKDEEKLFVAASTHRGEEEAVLKVYKGLLNEFPYLKLLIAPRHPERALGIKKLVSKYGFSSAEISMLRGTREEGGGTKIFILDTVGELISFYAASDIVFVGGSLVKKGGHNILEPAFLGKPVLFGPQMFNFRDIAKLFLAAGAAIMVRNIQELKENIRQLLGANTRIGDLSRLSRKLILENQGATARNLEFIKKCIA